MKILIVDNTRLFQQVIAKVFASARLETVSADNGADALRRLADESIDVVCSSYYLADMTGIELCRRMRAQASGRLAPFILFTAQQPLDVVREAYVAGVTDIFEKQNLDLLLTFIQRLLAQREPIAGRVLVVEDSPALADYYARILRAYALQVDVTATAEDGLKRVAAADYDLVLTDIVLSGPMSGVTLVNQIRRLPDQRGEVPILATTAFDDAVRRVELFRLGLNDYVQKPVAEEELVARTRNLIAHVKLLRETRQAQRQAETQREQAYRELSYRASHDMVTDLGSRWAFEQELAAVLANPLRVGRYGLALVDIVSLRLINDTCGHDAGDALLRQIGEQIKPLIPAGSLAARLEGGRIGLLIEGPSQEVIAARIGGIVQSVEAAAFYWNERRFARHLIAGAIPSLAGFESLTEAIGRAETANAAAHAHGGSGVLIYDETDERIAARQRERHALPELIAALNGEGFLLFMQPIVGLQPGCGKGHEFLCRMLGSDHRLRAAGDFLPAAERYGLMPRLDRLVTRFALTWLAENAMHHGAESFFTINLSGQTISDPAFARFVAEALRSSGAPAERVYFEVTETAVMNDLDRSLDFMSAMRELGCRFALDDFGSGTASYSQLKNLPVQMVKIDGQFVRGMRDNPVDLAIIRSTCEVAKVMKLLTVAEFVESPEEAELLRQIGVDYGQGYGLGRPAPAKR